MNTVIGFALATKARFVEFMRSVVPGFWLTCALLFLFLSQISAGFTRCMSYLIVSVVFFSLYVWATKNRYYNWGYHNAVVDRRQQAYDRGMYDVNEVTHRLVECINCAAAKDGVKATTLRWELLTDLPNRRLGAVLKIGNVTYSLRGDELWAQVGEQPATCIYNAATATRAA